MVKRKQQRPKKAKFKKSKKKLKWANVNIRKNENRKWGG